MFRGFLHSIKRAGQKFTQTPYVNSSWQDQPMFTIHDNLEFWFDPDISMIIIDLIQCH